MEPDTFRMDRFSFRDVRRITHWRGYGADALRTLLVSKSFHVSNCYHIRYRMFSV